MKKFFAAMILSEKGAKDVHAGGKVDNNDSSKDAHQH